MNLFVFFFFLDLPPPVPMETEVIILEEEDAQGSVGATPTVVSADSASTDFTATAGAYASRYKTMSGYQVQRKAGWDTHGLPVELQVEKELGLTNKQQIEEYGIKEFNQKCRESVFSYEAKWRNMTERMAYEVDLDNPYPRRVLLFRCVVAPIG